MKRILWLAGFSLVFIACGDTEDDKAATNNGELTCPGSAVPVDDQCTLTCADGQYEFRDRYESDSETNPGGTRAWDCRAIPAMCEEASLPAGQTICECLEANAPVSYDGCGCSETANGPQLYCTESG